MSCGVISSVRVTIEGSHEIVAVWNRGGCAGRLVVRKGDGETIAQRLLSAPTLRGMRTADGETEYAHPALDVGP